MVKHRNNIVFKKRNTPKKVTLPNGRTFYAKYRRVNRHCLSGGTTIQRTYRGRPVQGHRPRQRRPRQPKWAKPAAAVRGKKRVRFPSLVQGSRGIGDIARTIISNPHVQDIGKKNTNKEHTINSKSL